MQRFLQKLKGLDWPNHLLTFAGTLVGVFLAFYLASYQERQRAQQRLELARSHIYEEIQKNYENTVEHIDQLESKLAGFQLAQQFLNDSFELVTTLDKMTRFQEEHPSFFEETSRTAVNDSLYKFKGDLSLNYTILGLSDIAWENAKALDVLHLMEYQESFKLHSLYRFQAKVQEKNLRSLDIYEQLPEERNKAENWRKFFRTMARYMEESLSFEKNLEGLLEHTMKDLGVEIP